MAIIGVYLADHRGIFTSPDRREKLIACLDIFVDAGWPAARRLLYRLPELLLTEAGARPSRCRIRMAL